MTVTSTAAPSFTHPTWQTYHKARWLECDLALKSPHASSAMSSLLEKRQDGGELVLSSVYCALGTGRYSFLTEGPRSR